MYLSDISDGCKMNVILDANTNFEGEHDGIIDHLRFHLHCPQIWDDIDKYKNTDFVIECDIKGNHCSFTIAVLGRSERQSWSRPALDVRIKTPIKAAPRREAFRVEIKMKTKIHAYVDNNEEFFSGELLSEAVTEDISRGGVRIWSDYVFDAPMGAYFVLEFSQPLKGTYHLPAKIMRNKQNTATRAYSFDLGFAFDFSRDPEQMDKFIMDVVEAKLRGEGRLH